MRPLSLLRLLLAFAALGLLAAFVLSGRSLESTPGDVALALDALRSTPDAQATRAVATFQAALSAPPPLAGATGETPILSMTPPPPLTALPAEPLAATPTPKRAATAMALRREVNTAVAATLTAQPTAMPLPAPPAPPPTPPVAVQPDVPPANGLPLIGVVDGGGLVNLRAGPGLDYAVLMGVDSGAEVIVLGRNEGADWLQIRTASGALGWMAAMYVRTGQAAKSYPVVGASP